MDVVRIYEDYYQYIYNYALKLTCHPEDAMDLTQETFLKAMKNMDTLVSENALSSWLRTICFHEFLNMVKKNENKYLIDVKNISDLEMEYNNRSFDTTTPEKEVIVADEIQRMPQRHYSIAQECERLNYHDTDYAFDENVRSKIKYLYANMPEWKPSDDWYKKVKKILQNA